MGSALMGSQRISCFNDRGTFWVLPLTYFHLPKSARAYAFPQSVKNNYFCSGPISVDPICPQPKGVRGWLLLAPSLQPFVPCKQAITKYK